MGRRHVALAGALAVATAAVAVAAAASAPAGGVPWTVFTSSSRPGSAEAPEGTLVREARTRGYVVLRVPRSHVAGVVRAIPVRA